MPKSTTAAEEVEVVIEAPAALMAEYLTKRKRNIHLAREQLKRYYNDPVAWARNCIRWPEGQSLTAYQEEVLAAIPIHGRVAQRGPHGLGKSTTSAIALLWFVTTREASGVDWKCITTAGGWHQLEHYLWPEVHKWAKLIRWERLGRQPFSMRTELLKLNLNLKYGSAFAVASTDPARIEGAHADSIFYIYDESKVIRDETFDAAEGAFSGATKQSGREAFALASSTPGEPTGRFYDIHSHKVGFEDWWTKHVTLYEAIRAGRVGTAWAKQRKRQWGANSQLYANRVLGEFHSSDEDSVIPLSWIEMAVQRWHDNAHLPLAPMERLGLDVAGAGEDKTVFAPIHNLRVPELQYVTHEDTTQLEERAKLICAQNKGVVVVVDADGMGVGVYDHLNNNDAIEVEAFHAGAKTDKKDKSGELEFADTRSAAWWQLREMLDPIEGSTIELPDDDLLIGDLVSPKWEDRSAKGVIKVESKKDIKKRLSRSTDSGDAVMMGFWRPRKRKRARMHVPVRS